MTPEAVKTHMQAALLERLVKRPRRERAMRRTPVVAAVLALLTLLGCSARATPTTARTSVTIHADTRTVTVKVSVADTPSSRERGLMGRTSLQADRGMVFLFTDAGGPVTTRFWMKDTAIPLSIAFWDASGRIVAIRDMVPCTSDPCRTYGSPMPYVGALEVNRGFFRIHGIVVGDRVELG
jgi:uncharacterized membrane protein (UPF0127 family)